MTKTAQRIPFCVYCGETDVEGSLEHLWPQGLGGAQAPELFRTRDVCRKCNNKCGLFVDAPFIKSWVLKGASAFESLWYADLSPDSRAVLPPIYWGVLADDLALGAGLSCEVWLSACRGVIFHVHSNLTDEYAACSGGNPIGQKRNPGVAYFFNKASDMRWVALGLRSFRRYFLRQKRVLPNLVLNSEEQHRTFGLKPSESDDAFALELIARYGETLSMPVSISMQFGADQRFLCAKLNLEDEEVITRNISRDLAGKPRPARAVLPAGSESCARGSDPRREA